MPDSNNDLHAQITIPSFRLKDANSNFYYSFEDIRGSKGTLLIFISNTCPFVHHAIPEILMIAADYNVQGLGIAAISSNNAALDPEEGLAAMTEFAFKYSFDFPYLYDENQDIARAFKLKITPDYYLFDNQNNLKYNGQLDDSRPGNGIPLSGSDLRSAIDGVIYNRFITTDQKPSVGCEIKWKNR